MRKALFISLIMLILAHGISAMGGNVNAGVSIVDVALAKQACQLLIIDTDDNRKLIGYGERSAVYVGAAQVAVAGGFVERNGRKLFQSAVPLTSSVDYRVEAEGCPGKNFTIAKTKASVPYVIDINPAADQLPENILRFRITFSQPMREDNFLRHIELKNLSTNKVLTDVFFDSLFELWSPDHRRLTIIVDPGRVKTGLKANEKLGRGFVAGQKYNLRVKASWRALSGFNLAKEFDKSFIIAPANMTAIDIAAWRIKKPSADSKDNLRVKFDDGRLVDITLIVSYMKIVDNNGVSVKGIWSVIEDGRGAAFAPHSHWQKGNYKLVVNSRFEDISGNNLNGAFDHKIGALIKAVPGDNIERQFNID